MKTFCVVNDELLVSLIQKAERRIVYVAPGLFLPVAFALCKRFAELGTLEVTLVLDPDEDVCRIGFGELSALQQVHSQSLVDGFYVRAEPRLRVGILQVDDQTIVWSPTPRAVEAVPETLHIGLSPSTYGPNGLNLGTNLGEQIAHAVCAEGTQTDPRHAEIGTTAITPQEIDEVARALADNPPIPINLARITRVFSSKLQFVELKIKGAKLAERTLSLASHFLNADANEHLRSALDAKLRAFADFKDWEIHLPMLVNGESVFDRHGKPIQEAVSEATLKRERHAIETEFIYDVPGFGRLIERARRAEFETRVNTFKVRLLIHAEKIRGVISQDANLIIEDALRLIGKRMRRGGFPGGLLENDRAKLANEMRDSLNRIWDEDPVVHWIFKDVAFEQTQDEDFLGKLDKALPAAARRRLGAGWYEKFSAAKQEIPKLPLLAELIPLPYSNL